MPSVRARSAALCLQKRRFRRIFGTLKLFAPPKSVKIDDVLLRPSANPVLALLYSLLRFLLRRGFASCATGCFEK